MTSTPFPIFRSSPPTTHGKALAAVGRCRVYPKTCLENADGDGSDSCILSYYELIVAKCREQVEIDVECTAQNKPRRKKLMKEAVALARNLIEERLQLDPTVLDVELVIEKAQDLNDTEGCLASCLLDAGASRIVVDGTAITAMEAAKVPRERIVAHFDSTFSSAFLAYDCHDVSMEGSIRAVFSAALYADVISINLSYDTDGEAIRDGNLPNAHNLLMLFQKWQIDDDEDNVMKDVNVICQYSLPAGDGGIEKMACAIGELAKKSKNRFVVGLTDPTIGQLAKSYVACINTDRSDGLYSTVVCTRSGEALGLVYSSAESIAAALECGRGVYYSRSRNGLWRKGDTSGHHQILHRIDVDCDGDALRFTVTQKGDDVAAFCHLNTLTCWGKPRGVRHLEETLSHRLKHAPKGSYTKRLFYDEQLLRDKLVEEAQELSEAKSKEHVAEELADVLYFAMVKAAQTGVRIDDAVVELDRRARKVTRRQGDSKTFRITAGDAILEEKGRKDTTNIKNFRS